MGRNCNRCRCSLQFIPPKAATDSITQALREMLEAQGTRVLNVHPGPITTDMGDAAGLTEIAEPPTLMPEGMMQASFSGSAISELRFQ